MGREMGVSYEPHEMSLLLLLLRRTHLVTAALMGGWLGAQVEWEIA